MGAGNCVTSGDLVIFMDQAAELVPPKRLRDDLNAHCLDRAVAIYFSEPGFAGMTFSDLGRNPPDEIIADDMLARLRPLPGQFSPGSMLMSGGGSVPGAVTMTPGARPRLLRRDPGARARDGCGPRAGAGHGPRWLGPRPGFRAGAGVRSSRFAPWPGGGCSCRRARVASRTVYNPRASRDRMAESNRGKRGPGRLGGAHPWRRRSRWRRAR